MAKTGSYIKIDRGLKNHAIWLEKPFSKGQAWVDLLILAQGVDKDKTYRGRIQKMRSGEVYTSICYLEKRWGWSRNKVYRFLSYLVDAGMIAVQGWEKTAQGNGTRKWTRNGTRDGTVITVENWAFYQYDGTTDGTTDGTRKGTTKRHTQEKAYTEKAYTEKADNNKGAHAPDSPSGKNDAHLRLKPDQGTVDDIPESYRDMFDSFEDYWRYRNQ